jgi:hypothetical protein
MADEFSQAKRRKVELACDQCRRSRTRCDGQPECWRCRARKTPCTYGNLSRGKLQENDTDVPSTSARTERTSSNPPPLTPPALQLQLPRPVHDRSLDVMIGAFLNVTNPFWRLATPDDLANESTLSFVAAAMAVRSCQGTSAAHPLVQRARGFAVQIFDVHNDPSASELLSLGLYYAGEDRTRAIHFLNIALSLAEGSSAWRHRDLCRSLLDSLKADVISAADDTAMLADQHVVEFGDVWSTVQSGSMSVKREVIAFRLRLLRAFGTTEVTPATFEAIAAFRSTRLAPLTDVLRRVQEEVMRADICGFDQIGLISPLGILALTLDTAGDKFAAARIADQCLRLCQTAAPRIRFAPFYVVGYLCFFAKLYWRLGMGAKTRAMMAVLAELAGVYRAANEGLEDMAREMSRRDGGATVEALEAGVEVRPVGFETNCMLVGVK